jgi:hypothetical protein
MAIWTIDAPPKGYNILKKYDTVLFNVAGTKLIYTVYENYLGCPGLTNGNSEVFRILGMDSIEARNSMAIISYGYPLVGATNTGCWPASKDNDYPALTRLVNNLYARIKENNPKSNPIDVCIPKTSTTYTNHYRPAILKVGDKVVFKYQDKHLYYEVCSTTCLKGYLFCSSDNSNDLIFSILGLDKNKVASTCYGYLPTDISGGGWPECRAGDMLSLTRLVNHIYHAIDNKSRGFSPDKDYAGYVAELIKEKEDSTSINLNSLNNGKTVKVEAITPKIIRGEERRGCSISGRAGRTSISLGHLSYKTIAG